MNASILHASRLPLDSPTGLIGEESPPSHPTSGPVLLKRLPKTALPPVPFPKEFPRWEGVGKGIAGNFSVVHRARPKGRGNDFPAHYAIKILHPHWHNRRLGQQIFQREREIGKSVSHPHIVPVLDAGFFRESPFLVMPWLEGRTLRELLEEGKDFSLSEVLWIARQATEALEALHEAKWLHNDIKPENLFLSPRGHVTLIDLGFAQRFVEAPESSSSWDRVPLGTLNYMAPEKGDSHWIPDSRSDLYSLGIVLFELLAGMPPRIVNRLDDLLCHPVTPEQIHAMLPPQIPKKIADLIAWMTHASVSHRVDTHRTLLRRWYELEIENFGEGGPSLRPPHFQPTAVGVHSKSP